MSGEGADPAQMAIVELLGMSDMYRRSCPTESIPDIVCSSSCLAPCLWCFRLYLEGRKRLQTNLCVLQDARYLLDTVRTGRQAGHFGCR